MQENFRMLYGNEKTKNRLASAIRSNTLPHALLIAGPRGSGKHTLARSIGAALNCEHKGEGGVGLPCGSCNTCRRVLGGKFTDFKVLSRAAGKASIGASEVRYFREDMFLSATESEYKIYMIENCEAITPQGQNALLKVLEEPPERVIIMLLTESTDKILSTIKSRVQLIRMEQFEMGALAEALVSLSEQAATLSGTDPDAYSELLIAADGRIGEGLRMMDAKALAERRQLREDTDLLVGLLIPGKSYADTLGAMSSLPKSRGELSLIFESVTVALRDLIALKADENAPLLYYTDRSFARQISSRISKKRLFLAFDVFQSAMEKNSQNANTSSIGALIASGLKQ